MDSYVNSPPFQKDQRHRSLATAHQRKTGIYNTSGRAGQTRNAIVDTLNSQNGQIIDFARRLFEQEKKKTIETTVEERPFKGRARSSNNDWALAPAIANSKH